MAVRAYSANVGQALPGGFNSVYVSGSVPATAAADAAQAAAEANGTISGDGTALGLVQAIASELAADKADADQLAGDATLLIDTAVITTRNKLRSVLETIYQAAISNGLAA